jgi:hypothetical protein
MSYTIEIHYRTGNSFGSSDEKDTIGCVWQDKEQAQLALSYIKEHYECYKQVNGWNPKTTEKDMNKLVSKKPWVTEELDYWQYGLMLPCGEDTQRVSAFWCGYFETLYSARIISTEDDMDSFSID